MRMMRDTEDGADVVSVSVEEIIGERIRLGRRAMGLTQDGLGRRLDVIFGMQWSRQAVCQAEKGKRLFTAAEMMSLSMALGVHIGWLYGEAGPTGVPPGLLDLARQALAEAKKCIEDALSGSGAS